MSRLALAVLPLGFAAAAAAQTPNETAAAPALPVPAAPVITLPRAPAPTPTVSPTPAARPTNAARSTPRAISAARAPSRPTATPTPTPTPSPIPTSAPSPSPEPSATPSAVASPAASPSATPRAAASPVSDLARTPAEAERVENPRYWAAIIVALLALAAGGFLGWRGWQARRARRAAEELARQPHVTVAGAVPPPPPPAEALAVAERPGSDVPTFWTPSRPANAPTGLAAAEPPAPPAPPPLRPRVAMALHPRRAGINLVSATADLELTVRNEGDGAAEAVAVSLRLLAGRAGQDGELGELFGTEQGRPVLPPFALAPGEQRVCRTTLVLPRAEIEPIPVKGRPMFVPVVAADVRYLRPDGGRGQTAAAFVIGAARPGSEKLAPFWLDVGSKMRDDVEARPHGLAIES